MWTEAVSGEKKLRFQKISGYERVDGALGC